MDRSGSDLDWSSLHSETETTESCSVRNESRFFLHKDERITSPLSSPREPSPRYVLEDILGLPKKLKSKTKMSRMLNKLNKNQTKDKDSFATRVLVNSKPNEQNGVPNDKFTLPSINLKSNSHFQNRSEANDLDTGKYRPNGSSITRTSFKKKNRRKVGSLMKLFHQIHDVAFPPNSDGDKSDIDDTVRNMGSLSLNSAKTLNSGSSPNRKLNSSKTKAKTSFFQPVKVSKLTPIDSPRQDNLSIVSFDVEDLRWFPHHSIDGHFNRRKFSEDVLKVRAKEIEIEVLSMHKSTERETFRPRVFSDDDLECWMSNLPSAQRRIPLHQLLIPGSHDSFSYSLEWGKVGPDSPAVVSHLASCSPCIAWPALLRWSITQRSTVYEQLMHGIRYFDIRVAMQDKRFYFVHGLFGEDLELLLAEIKRFLDLRHGEVVLLDFQHLYGLTKDQHLSLIYLLRKIFLNLICPPYESLNHLSLSYLSKQKYQVLIFYRNSEIQKESGFWSGSLLPNPWPQTTSVSNMMSFVKNELAKKSEQRFFVTQCVLTPSGSYLVRNLTGSLEKKMAVPCNEKVLQWILSLPIKSREPNVVMIDFVEDNDWAIPKAVVKHNVKETQSHGSTEL